MNSMPVTEADLHAYVDGVLSEARHEEIAAYLASHPEELARVNAYRAQNEGLRHLFSPVLDEPVPAGIAAGITADMADGVAHRHGLHTRIAASVLIALAGGIIGWILHGATTPAGMVAQGGRLTGERPVQVAALAHEAAVAHLVYTPDARRPVEIGADQEEQLVKWLTKRTGADMHPPKLGKLGYELVGGRLLPGDSGKPDAQFMYQDADGRRLTLYVSTDQEANRDTGFRFARQGEVNVFYWIDGRFGYALSGGIDKGELARIADTVYDQLNRR
jgi:anti-sigma factor RsiW